jgi:L-threonylcarbamoyladenylate synthase
MTTSPNIPKAAALLHAGGLVAFPTETVYGLGADAANERAVQRIFEAKERPFDHPLIVHIASLSQWADWARELSPLALTLAHAFWPGPLTMVLKKQPHVLDRVTGGQDTVGLRIPGHPMAQALLQAFGGGVAAPSANKFTHISPTTAAAVYEELGKEVDLILDGGECEVGLESTIIDMSGDGPVILRPGMITAEVIAAVLGCHVTSARQDSPAPRAPGMHHLHYAPTTKTELIDAKNMPGIFEQCTRDLPIAIVVRRDIAIPAGEGMHWVTVTMPREASAYAHDLYQTLRSLDRGQFKRIMIERVPETAEWEAIRDRLLKASGS